MSTPLKVLIFFLLVSLAMHQVAVSYDSGIARAAGIFALTVSFLAGVGEAARRATPLFTKDIRKQISQTFGDTQAADSTQPSFETRRHYLRVKWIHEFADEPFLLYSELDGARNETRKVEFFPDGSYGYADNEGATANTQLSEKPIPSDKEIASDPQFEVARIKRADFEEIWKEATRPQS